MRNLIMLLLMSTFQLVTAQVNNKTATYKHGHNGMELIVTSKKETVIVSTFNSKLELKEDIARKVYKYYKDNKDANFSSSIGDTLIINGVNARVTGKFLVTKKGRLTAVEFYFEKIEWNTGLTEFYKKNFS